MNWRLPALVGILFVSAVYLVFFRGETEVETSVSAVEEISEGDEVAEADNSENSSQEPSENQKTDSVSPNQNSSTTTTTMGPKVDLTGPVADAFECFELRAPFVESDQVIDHFEAHFGKARDQQEIWSDVKMLNSSGEEVRYRIETRGFSDPVPIRDVYMVNKNPQESFDTLVLEDAKPEQIDKLFSQGQVTLKETTSFALFDNGERLEWTLSNGRIKTFEMMKEDKIFRCEDVNSRESCSCIK